MTTWIVSRHPGAIEWLQRQGFADGHHVDHLDPDTPRAGDAVVGTLPVSLIAELTRRGVRYYHLEIPMPRTYRGVELTAEDLETLGARVQRYEATRKPS